MSASAIRFSLIVATVNRSHQLTRLLASLRAQTYQNFEVIIVDQNPPGFLTDVVAPFRVCFPLLHLRSDLGLSLARNVGLNRISGQVVAFPDDDCWYPPETLQRIADLLTTHPEWDGLSGRPADPENPNSFSWYHRTSGSVDLRTVWRRSISIAIFLRREIVETVGAFDENLGLGTPTGMLAAEESEYMIRVLQQGFHLHYRADVILNHLALPYDEPRIARALGEGRSFGYVLRKYRYPMVFAITTWVRAFGGAMQAHLCGNRERAQYYWALLRGRLQGWFVDSRRDAAIPITFVAGKPRPHDHLAELVESAKSSQPERCSAARVEGA
jgi:glycosyltransferase involved in cell wall biosynthesis